MQTWRAGYVDESPDVNGNPRRVAPYRQWDAQIGYGGIADWILVFGVKNLFDRDPPYTNYGAGFVGGYDLSYTDVRGRFVYLTAAYTFKAWR